MPLSVPGDRSGLRCSALYTASAVAKPGVDVFVTFLVTSWVKKYQLVRIVTDSKHILSVLSRSRPE
jgi:hypothetical protein